VQDSRPVSQWKITPRAAESSLVRVGHSTTRAALIYQHRTTERDRFIAAAMSEIVKTELGEADGPSGTQRARGDRDAS